MVGKNNVYGCVIFSIYASKGPCLITNDLIDMSLGAQYIVEVTCVTVYTMVKLQEDLRWMIRV